MSGSRFRLGAADFVRPVAVPDKGKGREVDDDINSGSEDGSDSGGSVISNER